MNIYCDSLGYCIRVNGKWLEAIEFDGYFARVKDGTVYALCVDGTWW
jgi:hypothetical protein